MQLAHVVRRQLARRVEPVIDPGLPIIDPHHHLWHRPAERYRVDDLLRDLGWQVVRWVWADLDRPAAIAERVRRALARAHA